MADSSDDEKKPYQVDKSQTYGIALKFNAVVFEDYRLSMFSLNPISAFQFRVERGSKKDSDEMTGDRRKSNKLAEHLFHPYAKNSQSRTEQSRKLIFTQKELGELKSLVHPNILQFYGYSSDGFYTECPGSGTIHECFEHKDFVHLWARDLAAALCYLCDARASEKDVSTKNCFLFDDGRIVKLGPLRPSKPEKRNSFVKHDRRIQDVEMVERMSSMTYNYALLFHLLLYTRAREPFNYEKRPNFDDMECGTVVGKVVMACGRRDPFARPTMRTVLDFILYNKPELTRFPVDCPGQL